MKKILRRILGILKKNRFIKRKLKSVKDRVVRYIDNERMSREIYNYNLFYPSIDEYHSQLTDKPTEKDPLISILLPTYNTNIQYLHECIMSIIRQSYTKWELCIADDNSTDPDVVRVIKQYSKKDERIKYTIRKKNGHISAATNSALALASGTYVALMDHDDILWPNALHEIVKIIRADQHVDFIYTDEDKIDSSGKVHSYPFLKPDYSPEFLESCNYITHFSCIRTSVVKGIKGFTIGVEGAQDWDLFMRVCDTTKLIVHIPKILYSWRIHESSTAADTDAKPYVYEAQKKLLNDYMVRNNHSGVIETGIIKQHRTIKYDVSDKSTLVIVVQSTSVDLTSQLLTSMQEFTPGIEVEIYIVGGKEYEAVCSKHSAQRIESVRSVPVASVILYISDGVTFNSNYWAKYFFAETNRDGVGFVGPVILQQNNDNKVLSAGCGIGYGKGLYLNMLEDVDFHDQHYTRGLYLRSRRNVSALSPMIFSYNTENVHIDYGRSIVEQMIDATNNGLRNIYTPYIKTKARTNYPVPNKADSKYIGYEDPYLNPNFDHSNQYMEVAQ